MFKFSRERYYAICTKAYKHIKLSFKFIPIQKAIFSNKVYDLQLKTLRKYLECIKTETSYVITRHLFNITLIAK